MPINLFCPNLKCRAVLQVADKARGKKVRCGQCGTTFMVPAQHAPKLNSVNEIAKAAAQKKAAVEAPGKGEE